MSKKDDVQVFEKVDPVPFEVPIQLKKPESMDERIRRITQHSISRAAEDMGYESFEDADDFDIPDDPVDALSPWEADFDLAAVAAVDAGVAKRPQVEDDKVQKARNVLGSLS